MGCFTATEKETAGDYEIRRISATDFFIFRIDFYVNECYSKVTGTVPFRVLEDMRSIEGQSMLRYFYMRTGDSFRLAHGSEYPDYIVMHSLYTYCLSRVGWVAPQRKSLLGCGEPKSLPYTLSGYE